MKVTYRTHFISAPKEVTDRLCDLLLIAAYAEYLGITNLFNQAKEAYTKLASEWDSYANAQAKAKSQSQKKWGWLGIGDEDTYITNNTNKWESDFRPIRMVIEEYAKTHNVFELQNELKKLLDNINK